MCITRKAAAAAGSAQAPLLDVTSVASQHPGSRRAFLWLLWKVLFPGDTMATAQNAAQL